MGGTEITGERLWSADFSEPGDFRIEKEGGSFSFEGDQLVGDTRGKYGATIWTPQTFPSDVVVRYSASFEEDSDSEYEKPTGRNFNCFFAATDPNGDPETLAETERSGRYGDYHEIPNYTFTLTYQHSRLRRNPGFELQDELLLGVGDYPDHAYDITLVKQDGRIRTAVDGRLVHDWTDSDPYDAGWVGLRTWNTLITYDRWEVFTPV
jgi:hypothetical protein